MKDMSRFASYTTLAVVSLMPLFAAAQSGINKAQITSYGNSIISIIESVLVPLLFAIAFLYFVYGVYKYFILGGDNDTERATGRQFVLWSLIGFAVILSVWGLVQILLETFGITAGGTPPEYPKLL